METDGEVSTPPWQLQQRQLTNKINHQIKKQQQIVCWNCKKPGLVINECRKRIRKEQEHHV